MAAISNQVRLSGCAWLPSRLRWKTASTRNTAAIMAKKYCAAIALHQRCELSLLPPRWRARVEQRRAWIQQAKIVRSENALALVPGLQYLNAVLSRDGCAHEV